MIIKMHKYLFIGSKKDLDLFFARAQKIGLAEFIPAHRHKMEVPTHLERIIQAMRTLRKQPDFGEFLVKEGVDVGSIVDRVLDLKRSIENIEEETKRVEAEISRISPLRDFSLEDIREIERMSGKNIQFFCMKESPKNDKESLPKDLIHITTEYDLNYFMSVSSKHISHPGLVEMHFESSLGDLKSKLSLMKSNLKEYENELKMEAGFLPLMQEYLLEQLDRHDLSKVKKETASHLDDFLFAIEAWVPKSKSHNLPKLLDDLNIYVERIAVEKEDKVPTHMENKGIGKMGEDLVHIYDTPGTDDKDPSKWVFFSFALFFAMIISDAGYGLIYLAIALYLRHKFLSNRIKESVKRLIRVFTLLSISCVVWGVLSGSYFGIKLSPDNVMNKVSVFHYLTKAKTEYHIKAQDETYKEIITEFPDLKEVSQADEFLLKGTTQKEGITNYVIMEEFHDDIFLELSLVVGMIHLGLSFARYLRRNWSGIGWLFCLIGGYLYFPSMLDSTTMVHFLGILPKETSYQIGLQLLIGGFSTALILGLIQYRLAGLEEIAKAIQLFADTLSYLRLYALGLAAMILAATFNEIGQSVGLVGGLLILLIGHTVNIVIGTMGGVIHGLRLNFIEWYHYSFGGNGRLFRPLKLRIPLLQKKAMNKGV